ncbi:MAG TPA: hypothetical protein VGN16_03750 [Acidobacteriaceae bacterium]|jgi:hypothetical protein
MTRPEVELLCALFLMYAYECVYWLAGDDQAFTRSRSGEWNRHVRTAMSFTLLQRVPVIADPLLLLPGFVRTKSVDSQERQTTQALRRVTASLNAAWILELQCRVQAMLMFLFLPWVVWTHRLLPMWRPLTEVLVVSHLLLLVSLYLTLRRARIAKIASVMGPVILNPLGATRTMDLLAQTIFTEETNRAPRAK